MPHAAPQTLSPTDHSLEDIVAFVPALPDMTPKLNQDFDGVICKRSVPETVRAWLRSISPSALPEGRFVLEPHLVGACAEQIFVRTGISPSPSLTWLCQDAQSLADEISALSAAERVRLRIEAVFDNACAKLHVDNVVARIICSYRGPGTVLGRDQTPDEQVMSVPSGAPVLLKGKQWTADRSPTLRHRSPRIEGTGQDRLVLVLEGCPDDAILPTHDSVFDAGSIST